ncbi:nucleotidyl transferase AbiEii/AbiGii toxin family protein [Planctomycetota bacterium]
MSPRYATPAAFKQALEHRLRAAAQDAGAELARRRQLLVFERFLARLAKVFAERMVLKGGIVVELRLDRARTTKDIDLRLTGRSEEVLPQLQQAGALDLGDFMRFEVQPDPRHPELDAEGMQYQGRRFRVRPMLAGKVYGAPFGLDVAFAEPIVGGPEPVLGSDFLEFAGIAPCTLLVYPLESHIAEKLHAYTLPRTQPNSRVKDLPDMALLAAARPLGGAKLREAIDRTFDHRKTHRPPPRTPEPPAFWEPVYARMAEDDRLRWPSLRELHEAVAAFLDPVLDGRATTWDPSGWAWT